MEEELTLMNKEEICEGSYSFENETRGKSVIHHILVNRRLLQNCKKMEINEKDCRIQVGLLGTRCGSPKIRGLNKLVTLGSISTRWGNYLVTQ